MVYILRAIEYISRYNKDDLTNIFLNILVRSFFVLGYWVIVLFGYCFIQLLFFSAIVFSVIVFQLLFY